MAKKPGICTLTRAIVVRLCFAAHSALAVWRLFLVTKNTYYWYLMCALGGQFLEAVITLCKRNGHEWKWFCPSVFFYLVGIVPAIWFLELNNFEKRMMSSEGRNSSLLKSNETIDGLEGYIEELGLKITIPLKLDDNQWLIVLEQGLLLLLIVGRWVLPKGKLTHDQLSQLLLVYIGTAADIVEFFEAFKEDVVRYNLMLSLVILGIWSWSLLQFTMVLTATKARKDQSGLLPRVFNAPVSQICCSPDVYGIIISIIMQDAPFLALRLILIFYYHVVSYTNFFFTAKNALVMLLLLYRLIMVQAERRRESRKASMAYSESRMKLLSSRNTSCTSFSPPYTSRLSKSNSSNSMYSKNSVVSKQGVDAKNQRRKKSVGKKSSEDRNCVQTKNSVHSKNSISNPRNSSKNDISGRINEEANDVLRPARDSVSGIVFHPRYHPKISSSNGVDATKVRRHGHVHHDKPVVVPSNIVGSRLAVSPGRPSPKPSTIVTQDGNSL